MKQKRLAVLTALALMVLPMIFSGCEKEDAWSSSPASEPTATWAPTPTPSPAPTQAPTPTPEPTPSPAAVDVEALFQQNPIDAQEEEALANASNARDVYLALSASEESWSVFVSNLTNEVATWLSENSYAEDGDEVSEFTQEATAWTQEKDSAVNEILKALDEEGADELEIKNQAADTAVDFYRQRALYLCQRYAGLTGEFPDFESLLSAPMG